MLPQDKTEVDRHSQKDTSSYDAQLLDASQEEYLYARPARGSYSCTDRLGSIATNLSLPRDTLTD